MEKNRQKLQVKWRQLDKNVTKNQEKKMTRKWQENDLKPRKKLQESGEIIDKNCRKFATT